MKKLDFYYLDKAREDAGLFASDAWQFLGIGKATWYRWQEQRKAPEWAVRLLETKTGRLDAYGWNGWYIYRGVLYNQGLNSKYYNWIGADLMYTAFCTCPGHLQMRRAKLEMHQVNATQAACGRVDDAGFATVTSRLKAVQCPDGQAIDTQNVTTA